MQTETTGSVGVSGIRFVVKLRASPRFCEKARYSCELDMEGVAMTSETTNRGRCLD